MITTNFQLLEGSDLCIQDQLAQAVDDKSRLARAGLRGYMYLNSLYGKSAADQEIAVGKMSLALIQSLNLLEDESLGVAVACAALLAVRRDAMLARVTLTETEKVYAALYELSHRYNADL